MKVIGVSPFVFGIFCLGEMLIRQLMLHQSVLDSADSAVIGMDLVPLDPDDGVLASNTSCHGLRWARPPQVHLGV